MFFMAKHYRYSPRPHFYKHEDGTFATVYGRSAFADLIGGGLRELRRLEAAMDGTDAREANAHKGWEMVLKEEVDEVLGTEEHQYAVYGRWQETAPTSEQLRTPHTRLVRPPKPPRQDSFWLMGPGGVVHVIYGLRAFCDGFGFRRYAILGLLKGTQDVFYDPWEERPVTGRISHLVSRINPNTQELEFKGAHRKTRGPRPAWRLATMFELLHAYRINKYVMVIYGDDFAGRPSDEELEKLGVTWEQVFPTRITEVIDRGLVERREANTSI